MRKRTTRGLAIGLLLMAGHAQAGVYKCTQGGKTVYTDQPCQSAQKVDTTNATPPTASDRMRAQARKLRNDIEVNNLEYNTEVEKREQAECRRRMRNHRQAVADANKHKNDSWWQTRALNSGDSLYADCSKYMAPIGAGHRD